MLLHPITGSPRLSNNESGKMWKLEVGFKLDGNGHSWVATIFGRAKIESKCEMSDFATVKIRGIT